MLYLWDNIYLNTFIMVTKIYNQGEKIGNCIFLKELPSIVREKTSKSGRKRTRRVGLFKCKCGNEFSGLIDAVLRGNKNSCGCLMPERIKKMNAAVTTHGKTHHPLYNVWSSMIRRCESQDDISYKNYGGRGIRVCNKWHDINVFIEEMYPTYIKGYQIDRINNDGNYEPSNCRWVSRKQNSNNRRNNRYIEYNGERKTVSEWADIYKMGVTPLLYRLNHWKLNDVFTTPYPTQGNKNKNKLKVSKLI